MTHLNIRLLICKIVLSNPGECNGLATCLLKVALLKYHVISRCGEKHDIGIGEYSSIYLNDSMTQHIRL